MEEFRKRGHCRCLLCVGVLVRSLDHDLRFLFDKYLINILTNTAKDRYGYGLFVVKHGDMAL